MEAIRILRNRIIVVNTMPEHFDQIIDLCRQVYCGSTPWRIDQLESHLQQFPEGQFVAIEKSGAVVGMTASLIIRWDDYDFRGNWRDFTDGGMFTIHDDVYGRTLYGAEVMVHPGRQRQGIGALLYEARRRLTRNLGLSRIRAASRLRGYHRFARELTAQDYVRRVVKGKIQDPTLSFQIKHGFEVFDVVSGYLQHDPNSLGYAALIEWQNLENANVQERRELHPI